jgi:hypothetical protein
LPVFWRPDNVRKSRIDLSPWAKYVTKSIENR